MSISDNRNVGSMSLKFNLAVQWQSQGIIYVIRPLNGSPVESLRFVNSNFLLRNWEYYWNAGKVKMGAHQEKEETVDLNSI